MSFISSSRNGPGWTGGDSTYSYIADEESVSSPCQNGGTLQQSSSTFAASFSQTELKVEYAFTSRTHKAASARHSFDCHVAFYTALAQTFSSKPNTNNKEPIPVLQAERSGLRKVGLQSADNKNGKRVIELI
jgi:hypothetical protein